MKRRSPLPVACGASLIRRILVCMTLYEHICLAIPQTEQRAQRDREREMLRGRSLVSLRVSPGEFHSVCVWPTAKGQTTFKCRQCFSNLDSLIKSFSELFKKSCLALPGCWNAIYAWMPKFSPGRRERERRGQSAIHVRCFRKAYVAEEHFQFSSEVPKQQQQQ